MSQVLILDGHSRAAVEATQSLGRAGISICISTPEPDALVLTSRYARSCVEQPPSIPIDSFLNWLRDLDGHNDFELLIPSTESALQAFLALPDDSPLRRRAVLPSNRALTTALDRRLTYQLASQFDISIPGTQTFETLPVDSTPASFPLVLKPARSKVIDRGELRTFAPVIVRDAAARESVLREWIPLMPVLQQQYVHGWGVGIELLYSSGKMVWYFAHERLHEWPLTGGASTYRRAIEPPRQLLDASCMMLDALNWNGVAMIEFKRCTDGSFVLMEINPRLWGSLALSIDAGVDFPLGLWKLAKAKEPGPQPSYRRGLRTRHLTGDLVWLKANLFADRGDFRLLTRPRLKSLFEPLLVFLGRERWDHFSWNDPRPGLREIGGAVQIVRQAIWRVARIWSIRFRRTAMIKAAIARVNTVGKTRPPVILFLCEGNICRSPFAALVASRRLRGYRIHDAGLDHRAGRATPPNVKNEAERLGYDMAKCRSTPVSEELVRSADLLCFMEISQYSKLAERYPECLARAVPLALFSKGSLLEIADPDQQDAATTRKILKQIASAVDELVSYMDAPIAANDRSRRAP